MRITSLERLPRLQDRYDDVDRDGQIEVVHRRLVDEGVKHVYFQYVTLQGRVLAKAIPTEFWPKAARHGVRWPYLIAAGWHVSVTGEVLGEGGAATKEGLLLPDPTTFAVIPWDAEVARVFCSHYRLIEDLDRSGEPVLTDTRQLLMLALSQLKEETGIEAMSGCEPEMSWLRDMDSIDASVTRLPANVSPALHVGQYEDVKPVLKKVTEYGSKLGFEMIQAAYEDPNQLECNFEYDDFLATADRLITYRQICIQVAHELGMVATFMPKPIPGIMANGCHHHVSFWRDGRNILIDPGKSGRENLSEEGLAAVGGLLKHAPGLMALLAPTVNSYKRYTDANWSPESANWGYDNRTCAVRVLPGRLEVRLPDASVNPYLSHLAILAAVKDGWDTKADPGPAQEGALPKSSGTSGSAALQVSGSLPRTLDDALDAFERDQAISGSLPRELCDVFVEVKRDEWRRYCGAITDWDIATYFNYLP